MNSYTVASEVITEYQHWALSQKVLNKFFAYLSPKAKRSQVKAGLENTLMNLLFSQQTSGADLFMKADTAAITSGFGYADVSLNHKEAEACLKLIKNTFSNTSENFTDLEIIKINSNALEAGDFKLKRNQYIDKAFNFVRSKTDEETAANAVLRSALRYASIYAETRHIGPPQRVYDLFYDWGIRNEGFASPFNARLLGKPGAQFYSLFKDTDEIFGSAGSFFNLDQPKNPGQWCLDPPFTTELMTKVDSILKDWLATYTDLCVLLIIPESHTPANRPDETVTLKKDIHYYEGLEGVLKALPVNVCIHRYGNLEGFSEEAILRGYSK
ncbi:PCIF1 family methyltransferase [Psychroflexus sediminis]|uniref:Phosphorylated CTD interacting factor 1 WW domain-containing protein n=1 Tax=Psychroflexus sediminis TaxID=470826 RepID=A0A1G7YWQ4_9FLAO|nr:CTD-interacting factor [Psychroflexus sediminis]SDH00874.1 Phosphorylated CTD interacting factor 1 WW domain-containing protein [Psychroflexus sediminis]